uniref:DUF1758 domain-containing protein n=1 Tax=Syphacia muris TaxID=451379 RepID=A0A0N5AZI8_9BILA
MAEILETFCEPVKEEIIRLVKKIPDFNYYSNDPKEIVQHYKAYIFTAESILVELQDAAQTMSVYEQQWTSHVMNLEGRARERERMLFEKMKINPYGFLERKKIAKRGIFELQANIKIAEQKIQEFTQQTDHSTVKSEQNPILANESTSHIEDEETVHATQQQQQLAEVPNDVLKKFCEEKEKSKSWNMNLLMKVLHRVLKLEKEVESFIKNSEEKRIEKANNPKMKSEAALEALNGDHSIFMFNKIEAANTDDYLRKMANSFFDIGSQKSYIDHKVAEDLKLMPGNISISYTTTFDAIESVRIESFETVLAVQTIKGLVNIKVNIVENLSETFPIMERLRKKNNSSEKINEFEKPDIIIGIDNFFKFFIDYETREDGLCKIHTTIGTIIAEERMETPEGNVMCPIFYHQKARLMEQKFDDVIDRQLKEINFKKSWEQMMNYEIDVLKRLASNIGLNVSYMKQYPWKEKAEQMVIKAAQKDISSEEIERWNLIKDDNGVWRKSCKIGNINELQQIYLPREHPIVMQIVLDIHGKIDHASCLLTMDEFRTKFWIDKGKGKIAEIIKYYCAPCLWWNRERWNKSPLRGWLVEWGYNPNIDLPVHVLHSQLLDEAILCQRNNSVTMNKLIENVDLWNFIIPCLMLVFWNAGKTALNPSKLCNLNEIIYYR